MSRRIAVAIAAPEDGNRGHTAGLAAATTIARVTEPRGRGQRIRTAATGFLLLLLLVGHYGLRRHADAAIPLHQRAFYATDYVVAISLVGGRGFRSFAITGEQATWPESPTVLKFLTGAKDDLRSGRLKVFLDTARSVPPPPEAFGRILDLHVAALLWRTFGISWPVLFTFYALVSTAACLGVFVLARRLGGTAAGFLAAVLYTASPFETTYSVYSIRDLSPLWFAVATFVAAGAAGRLSRPATLLPAAAAAGVVATIGVGWRPDGMMLPPFAALVLGSSLLARGVPVVRTTVAVLVLAVSSFATWTGIERLAGGDVRRPPTIGFHIAAYGSHTRSNVLEYENAFLAAREDTQTYFNVAYFADAVSGRKRLAYGGREYAEECRRFFLTMARSEGYRWLTGFPRFYRAALAALGDVAALQSIPASQLESLRPPWARPLFRWVLDPLVLALPVLFAAGTAVGLTCGRDRMLAAALTVFSLAYAGALLAVLPESKHFGPMLLPLCVLAGQIVGLRGLAASIARWRPGWRTAAAAGGTAIAIGAAVMAVRAVAVADRRSYVSDIRDRLAAASADPAGTVEVRRFTGPWRAPGEGEDPVGFAIDVDTGDDPGPLLLRQERGRGTEASRRVLITRHALPPRSRVVFFVTALQGGAYRDIRSHRCVVEVEGTASLVAARRIPLEGWKRPLFAAVVAEDDDQPGNPTLATGTSATRLITGQTPMDVLAAPPE